MLFKFTRKKHNSGYSIVQMISGDTTLFSDGIHIHDKDDRIIAVIDKHPDSKYINIKLSHGCHAESMSHDNKLM